MDDSIITTTHHSTNIHHRCPILSNRKCSGYILLSAAGFILAIKATLLQKCLVFPFLISQQQSRFLSRR